MPHEKDFEEALRTRKYREAHQQALRHAYEEAGVTGVPMFVITSSLYDRDIAESYQLGASAVLCKPLSRAKLRDELVRVGALPLSQRPNDPAYSH